MKSEANFNKKTLRHPRAFRTRLQRYLAAYGGEAAVLILLASYASGAEVVAPLVRQAALTTQTDAGIGLTAAVRDHSPEDWIWSLGYIELAVSGGGTTPRIVIRF